MQEIMQLSCGREGVIIVMVTVAGNPCVGVGIEKRVLESLPGKVVIIDGLIYAARRIQEY
jgi:hypothetical protein